MKKMGIEFLLRVNDGNFQHREIKFTDVLEGQDLQDLGVQAQALTQFANDVLDGRFSSSVTSSQKVGKVTVDKVEPVLKNGKGVEVPKEDVKKVNSPKDQKENEGEVEKSEDKPQEGKAKAADKKAPKTTTKAETTVVTKAPKAGKEELYDRTDDKHKNQFSNWLDEVRAGWDEGDDVDAYATASKKLNGTPFRDSEGEILESFKEAFLGEVDAQLAAQ